MSEKYSKHSIKSQRKYKEDSTKSKTRKNSSQNHSSHSKGSKTPPLPAKSYKMEELLKKRHSLKQELERLEHNRNNGHSRSKHKDESRKRKYSEDTSNVKSGRPYKEKVTKKEFKTREKSPEYQDFRLDSEDEEDIIEQRRKQRKQLIEKLNQDNKLEMKHTDSNSDCAQNEASDETFKSSSAAISDNFKTKLNTDSDMFSEKDFVHKNITGTMSKEENNSQLTDNWDDPEGYYNIRIGDIINKKYTIKDILGQGVFANVVRVQDINASQTDFAVKIVRNNDLMYKTSLKEISLLKEINEADPNNKYHCIKFYNNFMHKGHLCLVLESLHMDMRTVLKKYGKHHGIHMKALISYSRQLFMALRLLKKIGIIHADIKPDNILVNEKKNVLKLCDFGSASKVDENELTPYLVSRYYRAPEIILGVTYGHGIDVWSTACTMYEMATGKILFTGNSNNKMLKCFMDLKGRISSKLLKKGKFKDQHFNYNNNFLLHKKDEISGRDKVVEIHNSNAVRDLYKDLQKFCKNLTSDEEKKLAQLKDVLDKMLILDPNQRASVNDCLKHAFIQQELGK